MHQCGSPAPGPLDPLMSRCYRCRSLGRRHHCHMHLIFVIFGTRHESFLYGARCISMEAMLEALPLMGRILLDPIVRQVGFHCFFCSFFLFFIFSYEYVIKINLNSFFFAGK
jgi:hypothetical protein